MKFSLRGLLKQSPIRDRYSAFQREYRRHVSQQHQERGRIAHICITVFKVLPLLTDGEESYLFCDLSERFCDEIVRSISDILMMEAVLIVT